MAVKIRLARHGKKGRPYYHIVVADARAPRDGRYIENIGHYNPTVAPADIEIDREKAVDWLQKGAQPTDTCRAILKYTGVLYKKHLLGGVAKGAFDEAEADRRFSKWLEEKEATIQSKKDGLAKESEAQLKARLDAEKKKAADMAAALSAKLAAAEGIEVEAPADGEAGEVEASADAAVADAPAEAAAPAEEPKAEEAPAEEPKAEAAAEEAPAAEEKPAEEAKTEEE